MADKSTIDRLAKLWFHGFMYGVMTLLFFILAANMILMGAGATFDIRIPGFTGPATFAWAAISLALPAILSLVFGAIIYFPKTREAVQKFANKLFRKKK